MNARDARILIDDAISVEGGTWADFGAGDGTFTRALVERLGSKARIYAVDRDAGAIASLERWAARHAPNVIAVEADLGSPFELPGLDSRLLDGMLLANTLHFFPDAEAVLARLAARVRAGGRVVLIEYDRRAASRWVPHPIPAERLPRLAEAAGLTTPRIVARRPSAFGGTMVVATAERRSDAQG